jgi:hypothetical protein
MGRLFLFVGITLFFAVLLAALVPLIFPDVMRFAGSLVCARDEQAVVERDDFSDRHGTGFILTVDCIGTTGQRRTLDTFAVILVEIGLFVPPALLLGLLGIAWLRRIVRTTPQPEPRPAASRPIILTASMSTPQPEAPGSLADKLRQIEEAYRAGLITADEYNRERQKILDGF